MTEGSSSTDRTSEASSLKAKGNVLFRNGEYLESVIEFTAAIELDPINPILYSNRSSAFLKLRQYFYALKDAETAISLNSKWSKGYYRKGQVEEAAESYKRARRSYEDGLRVNPLDVGLTKALANLTVVEAETLRRQSFQKKKYIILFTTIASLIIAGDLHSGIRIFKDQLIRWIVIGFSFTFGIVFSRVRANVHTACMNRRLQPPKDLLKKLGSEAESVIQASSTTSYSPDDNTMSTDTK